MNLYQYAPNRLTWIDPWGWSCNPSQAIRSIKKQLTKGREALISVRNKADAEEILRALISTDKKRPPRGGYMDTTKSGTFSPQKDASDWLPRPSSRKKGTYHWDDFNPNAKIGDHASEGAHLQIHTFDGEIIRIFY